MLEELQQDTFSQFGEDKWLVDNVELPAKGFYVDVGAGNPINLSNSYLFEKLGWNGLLIDADPRNFDLLLSNRTWPSFFSVVGAFDGFVTFYMNNDTPDISRVQASGANEKPLVMPVFKLDTILNLFGVTTVDILSIDIEGDELAVLAQYDFGRRAPRIVICEFNTSGQVLHEKETLEFFTARGYQMIHSTEANFIFIKV